MSKGIGQGTLSMQGLNFGVRACTSDDDSSPNNPVGQVIKMNDNRSYAYLRANEATLLGQIVRPLLGDATVTNIDAYSAAGPTITEAAAFTADRYSGAREEYYVSTSVASSGTGLQQCRRIVSNTAAVLTLDASFTTALDTTSDITIFSPYRVQLTSAAAQIVSGVGLSSITSGNYGWYQVKGFCPLVRCVGSTDPTIAHEIVVSSSTAGACKGRTAGGITATEASMMFGHALTVHDAADAANRGVQVLLNCPGW